MNQRRALDGVIRPLALEAPVRDPAKLIVDAGQDCVEAVLVPFRPIPQKFGKRFGKRIRHSRTSRPRLPSSFDTLHRKSIQINVLETVDCSTRKSFSDCEPI